jgi:serine protease Do
MRRYLLSLLLPPLLTAAPPAFRSAVAAAPCCTEGYASLLKGVLPSVVSLSVVKIAGQQRAASQKTARRERFFGSGFIIDPTGIIVTNRHVIQGAVEITAIFSDGTQAPAKLLAAANIADLAALKVDVGHPLPALDFADSSDAQIGDEVFAIGNPYGIGMSVSAGIVSALNRDLHQTPFDDDIQTDAAINPGNSGGPLVTVGGKVVGVDTALYTQTGGGYVGIGYAIPSNDVDFVVRHLLQPDLPRPSWIGVDAQDVSAELAKGFRVPRPGGSVIISVVESGPGHAAGLRPGDIILNVSDEPISDTRALMRDIALMDVGSPVELTIWRHDAAKTMVVTPIEWPNMGSPAEAVMAPVAMAATAPSGEAALKLAPLTPAAQQHFGISTSTTGILVESVSANSDSNDETVLPGDVIVNVAGSPVAMPDEVENLIRKTRNDRQTYVPILVLRKHKLRWVSYYTGVNKPE